MRFVAAGAFVAWAAVRMFANALAWAIAWAIHGLAHVWLVRSPDV